MKKFANLVGFDPIEKNTSVRTELVAGVVTFLAMAYILTVNPNQIVGAGSKYWAAVFMATALGAVIGTICFFCVPGVLETTNILVAIVLGAASGLSATGTNQAVKQLTNKTTANTPKEGE